MPFHSSLILYFVILIISLLPQNSDGSLNPKFEACESKTCGNNQTISYPFYIEGIQEPFCGYPGFGLSCGNDGFPFLNMSDDKYMIHQIFYNNNSLRVSNAVFSRPNTRSDCLSRTHNLTLSGTRLALAPNQCELVLFFECDNHEGLQEHRIGCSEENKTSSAVAIIREDRNLSFSLKNCKGGVVNVMVENKEGGVREALRRGFVVRWNVSDCNKCRNSGGKCGFDKGIFSFRCYCPHDTHARKCSQENSGNSVVILATVFAAAGFGVLIIAVYYFRRNLWFIFWKEKSRANQDFEVFLSNYGPLGVRRYSYLEIKKMTNSFKEKLGQGGYGSVFKGKLEDESLVAVKVLNELKGNGEEFINEVASISRTSHVNIVTLIGFCCEESKKALVYEFMANGSLEKFIFETNNLTGTSQLNCDMLYQIAVGVGRGLKYLHRGCNTTRIFHFDIKPHNILLDENFCPKISDFGLAKICPINESVVSMMTARGTIGYIAPEVYYRNIGIVSHKSDVYSYGMMVLEMVGGRKNTNVEADCTSEIYFPYWIYKRLELNQEIALRNVVNESDRGKIKKMVLVSLWCIQTDPSQRPTMHRVVEMLEGNVETIQVPPKPFLSTPSRSPRSSPSRCVNAI